jgi:3-oxoacyl-[acyl-carrier-protein] synthase-3
MAEVPERHESGWRMMNRERYSVITATGSYLPEVVVKNDDFLSHAFHAPDGRKIDKPNAEIIRKFEEITGIRERRYVGPGKAASDIAAAAARDALDSSRIDPESLDYIIVAHNFGDVRPGRRGPDFVPSLASRVKHLLRIANPRTVAYDLPFGCPGWLQGIIQADYYIRSGDVSRILVIGTETLSLVSDPNDRDSMIYADGAGAAILEAVPSAAPVGILAHAVRTDTLEHAFMLWMGPSFDLESGSGDLLLKMNGHKLYEYALKTVPLVVRESIEKAGVKLGDIRKVLIHQANEKMDEAILKRLFSLYGIKDVPPGIMPMTISWLGNSSVATLPTMFDHILKRKIEEHVLESGETIVFASVGAGMNINSVVYRMP